MLRAALASKNMNKDEADKIQEIINSGNVSKLSIRELNKQINLINSIFPNQAKEFMGESDIISIRQILSTTLQTHIFYNARRFTIAALIISIVALTITILDKCDSKPILVSQVQPSPENQGKKVGATKLQKSPKGSIAQEEGKLPNSKTFHPNQGSDASEATFQPGHVPPTLQQKSKDNKKDVLP